MSLPAFVRAQLESAGLRLGTRDEPEIEFDPPALAHREEIAAAREIMEHALDSLQTAFALVAKPEMSDLDIVRAAEELKRHGQLYRRFCDLYFAQRADALARLTARASER